MCAVAPRNVTVISRTSPSLVAVLDASEGGNRWGKPKLGSTVPRKQKPFALHGDVCDRSMAQVRNLHVLASLRIGWPQARRRSVPPGSSRRRCRSRAERPVGRERPPFGCRLLRPTPGPQAVAHAPHACHDHPARRRDAGDTAECGARVERRAHVVRVTACIQNTPSSASRSPRMRFDSASSSRNWLHSSERATKVTHPSQGQRGRVTSPRGAGESTRGASCRQGRDAHDPYWLGRATQGNVDRYTRAAPSHTVSGSSSATGTPTLTSPRVAFGS
jgi:hypothetical protein